MELGSTLHVYKGEYGLPSIDFECLRSMCLIRFTKCPIKIEFDGNPFHSGEGKLPYLQIGNKKYVGYREIKQLMDIEGFSVNANLMEKEKILASSWTEWVFTKLHAYYNYFMYIDPTNVEITRALYARRTPFPFNFIYPSTYTKEACEVIQVMTDFDPYDKVENHATLTLTNAAKKAVTILSVKLGKKIWFFGNVFSEFDAIVYSYLSILYHVNLSNNTLKNHIKGCKNLVNYINRISKDAFKNDIYMTSDNKQFATSDSFITPSEQDFLESQTKTKVFAAIGAVLAMGSFLAWRSYSSSNNNNRLQYVSMDYDDDDDGDDNDLE